MRWLLLLLLGGCDLAFLGDQQRFVEVELVQRVNANDPSGMPFTEDVPFGESLEVRALDLDGTSHPITATGATTYTFLANDTYRFVITDTKLGITVEFQVANEHTRIVWPSLGRRDATFGGASADLVVDLGTSLPLGGSTSIVSTGVYTSAVAPAGLATFSIPWNGKPLVQTARGDRLHVVHFDLATVGNDITSAIDAAVEIDNLAMASNTDTAVTATLAPLPRDQCARVAMPRADELQRLTTAWGREVSIANADAGVIALFPNADITAALALGAIVGPATNATVDLAYGNAFPRHGDRSAILDASVYSAVDTNGIPIQLGIVTRTIVPLAGPCPAVTDLAAPVAIAERIAIDAEELVSDGQRVRLDRDGPIPVTWSLGAGSTGAFTTYLYRLTTNPSSPYELINVLVTNQPRVELDERDLDVGSTYALLVLVMPGVTGAADADFTMRGPPSSSARWSHTFTIEN